MARQQTMFSQDNHLSWDKRFPSHFASTRKYHLSRGQAAFLLHDFACYASTFRFLYCYFRHFDRSEETHDRDEISLAGQHDRQQFKFT